MSTDFDEAAFKAFEREGYSRVAETYADKTAKVTGQANETILNSVDAKAGTHLLDVACGPGLLSALALKRGAIVNALDYSPTMVALARRLCPAAQTWEGDAENLPFEDDHFDAVACNLGILHFANPERAVTEAFRVLKDGGRYAFTCWTAPSVNPFMGLILGSIQAHGTLDVDLPEGPPLFRFSDAAECRNVLKKAGFSEIDVTEAPLIWPFAIAEELVHELPTSTARLGPLLEAQTQGRAARLSKPLPMAPKRSRQKASSKSHRQYLSPLD